MNDEPENLILTLLRETRGEIGDVRGKVTDMSEKFVAMREEMREWQETIATAAGFAMHSNLRGQKLEDEVDAVRKRGETLEQAK